MNPSPEVRHNKWTQILTPTNTSKLLDIPVKILFLILSLFLLLVGGAGYWMRPIADDYFFLYNIHRYGIFGSVVGWFLSWHGRWTSQIVMNILYSTGYGFIQFLPAVLIATFIGSMSTACRAVTGWRFRDCLLLAVAPLGLTLFYAPKPSQSIYWAAASLYHTLPLVLCWLLIPLFVAQERKKWHRFAAFFLALALAGMSEAFTLIFIPILIAVAIKRRDKCAYLALSGAVLSAAIMFLAPGNAIRAASVTVKILSLKQALFVVLRDSGRLIQEFADPLALLVGLACLFVAYHSRLLNFRLTWKGIVTTVVLSGLMTFALIAPSVLAMRMETMPRVLFTPCLLINVVWIALWTMAGIKLRQTHPDLLKKPSLFWYPCVILSFVLLAQFGREPLRKGRAFLLQNQDIAMNMDYQDTFIKERIAKGQRVIEVPIYEAIDLHSIEAAPNYSNESLVHHYDKTGSLVLKPRLSKNKK